MTISLNFKMCHVETKFVDNCRNYQFIFRRTSPKSLVCLQALPASPQLKIGRNALSSVDFSQKTGFLSLTNGS